MKPRTAVLLVAHGSPDSPADVPEFMRYVTGGRPLEPAAMEAIARRYAAIGRSPLRQWSERQAELLRQRAQLPVYLGMRNWRPFIREALMQMAAEGVSRAVAICLAPQNSRTSVGLYRKAIFQDLPPEMEMRFLESWHDHPLLIRAFAEELRPAWRRLRQQSGREAPVIFTAHSVPTSTIQAGDPYAEQARSTAALVAAQAPEVREWRLAFQSQGLAAGEWLGPTVEETILELAAAGHSAVLLQPVGFLCDHVEVLYDIDVVFTGFARSRGLQLERTPSLNGSPLVAEALAELARAALARPGEGAPAAAAG